MLQLVAGENAFSLEHGCRTLGLGQRMFCRPAPCMAHTSLGEHTAKPFAGPQVVVRPIKEAFASRLGIIFPEAGARLSLANAFANDLREEIRLSERS